MPKQTLQQKIRRALGRFTAKRIAMILLGTAILSFGIHNIHQRTAITEASNEKYMYFKIAFWELSDDKTMTSYVPDSTIYYCADGSDYQYNVTGLTAGKQYKITISYDNGNKYYVTGGLKVEGLGSTELNTYGDDTTTG